MRPPLLRSAVLAAVAVTVLHAGCRATEPTPLPPDAPTEIRPTGPAGLAIPDPDDLPRLSMGPGIAEAAQLLFSQAGEVVRWPPQGGSFQVLGRGAVIGALDVDRDGQLLAFVAQDPATSTVTATVSLVDVSGPEALLADTITVETSGDLNMDWEHPFALDVARDAPVAAWSVPGAVYVWRPGDESASRVDWCNAVPGQSRPDPCTDLALSADGAHVTYRDVLGWRTSTTTEPFRAQPLGPEPSASASSEPAETAIPVWHEALARLSPSLAMAEWEALETRGAEVVLLSETGSGAVDGARVVLLAGGGYDWARDLSGLLAGASNVRLAGSSVGR